MKTIGQRIRDRRKELDMSQEELAAKLGYKHKSSIGKIENGQQDIVQSKVVEIAHALDTTVAFLMGWEEEQKKNDIQADIILKMRTDTEFMSVVETLYKLDKDKLHSINQMLNTLFK